MVALRSVPPSARFFQPLSGGLIPHALGGITLSTTPAERTLVARIAANESWGRTTDRAARTAPARRALEARFEAEVDARDPEGRMSAGDRQKAIENVRRAHFARLALKSAQARRRGRSEPVRDQASRDILEDLGLAEDDGKVGE